MDQDHNGSISEEEVNKFCRAVATALQTDDHKPIVELMFNAADIGKKGYLTSGEFRTFMKLAGKPLSFFDRTKTLNLVDDDHDGKVTLEEIHRNLQVRFDGA
jgi:Ca2+-binding EF-hand superfamily protein